jgi:hypothetical protein
MPNTYAFPFKDTGSLESQSLNIRRYRFAISGAVNDFWNPVEQLPVLNPPFLPNFPIDVRVTTPFCTSGANWTTRDGNTNFWSQGGIGTTLNPTNIPNPLISSGFAEIYNIDGLAAIGPLAISENSGSDLVPTFCYGGSIMVNTANTSNPIVQTVDMMSRGLILQNTSANGQNLLDVTNAVKGYARNIRTANIGPLGYTCAFIISGAHGSTTSSFALGDTLNEANYIRDITDSPGSWKQRFFDTSSYITFKSTESTVPSMITGGANGEMSWRRSLPYKYSAAAISQSDITGITAQHTGSNILNDLIFDADKVNSLSQFLADASNGWSIGINDSPEGEGTDSVANASLNLGLNQPPSISCFNNSVLYNFVSYSGNTVRISSGSNTLFIPTSLSFTSPYFIRAFGLTTTLSGYSLYTADTTSEPMILRLYYPTNFGNKNILAMKYKTQDSKRLFGGADNIGIQVGSYIQISGSTYESNNKIYQVTAVYDGMPGDPSMKFQNGTSIYQAIELNSSLDISPDGIFPSVTIKNVSSLPILHVRYRDS